MNCKFHPTADSVTKCAKCGAEMCFYCDRKAFFRSEEEEGKPLCLECSLKKAKIEYEVSEEMLKDGKKRRTTALVLWFVGLPMLALGGFGILLMIAASIVYEIEVMAFAAAQEKTFSEKIKMFLFGVLIETITCPFSIIKESNKRKKEIKKTQQKFQEVAAEAVEVWTKAADQGDACAQYNLGELYIDGDGVTQNNEKAIELWTKSAEQGFAKAQCALGYMYNEGEGVEKDYAKAVEWFTKAAEQGFPPAFFALGSCYGEGEGVTKDEAKAVEYYKMGAAKGDDMSQCALGICYRDGTGVAKDMVKAFECWKLSAEQGNEKAKELLKENS
jgi:hypothetical protein